MLGLGLELHLHQVQGNHMSSRPARAYAAHSVKAVRRGACIALVLSAVVPTFAAADQYVYGSGDAIDYDGGFNDGTQPAKVTIENNVVTITNPAGNGQTIRSWDIDFETTAGVREVDPGAKCNIRETWNSDNTPSTFGCFDLVRPGETKSWRVTADADLNESMGTFPGILVRWIDNDCVHEAARVFRATLDECDRDSLGTPRLRGRRLSPSKIRLQITGAPANW